MECEVNRDLLFVKGSIVNRRSSSLLDDVNSIFALLFCECFLTPRRKYRKVMRRIRLHFSHFCLVYWLRPQSKDTFTRQIDQKDPRRLHDLPTFISEGQTTFVFVRRTNTKVVSLPAKKNFSATFSGVVFTEICLNAACITAKLTFSLTERGILRRFSGAETPQSRAYAYVGVSVTQLACLKVHYSLKFWRFGLSASATAVKTSFN